MQAIATDQLIDGCKKGDLMAQKNLFLKYKDMVYTLSLKYCKNSVEAEDNVHDVFIIIFETIHKFKKTGSFEGWIKRIAIYKAIDKYKRKKPFEYQDYISPITTEVHIASSSMNIPLDMILKAIQELPDRYRLVFNLYQMDKYSHKEIAALLSISEGTSKSNLHRSKLLLKEKISTYATNMKLNS